MYLLLFVACFLFWGHSQRNAEAYYKVGLWLLFLVTALRHPALGGADNFQYYEVFRDVPSIGGLFNYESKFRLGYLLMNCIPKAFSDKYIVFQVFYTGICIFLLYKVIELLDLSGSEKCLFLFGLFCYDFLWYFWGTLRQNVSDLLFFYLLFYYYKNSGTFSIPKRIVVFVLLLLIPNLFHSSALLGAFFLPFLLVFPKEPNAKARMWIVLLGSVVLFLTSHLFFGSLASLASRFDDRFVGYTEDAGVSSNVINLVFRLGIFSLFCLNYEDNPYPHKKFILDLFTLFALIASINYGIAGRIAEYYIIGLYVAMSLFSFYNRKFRGVTVLFFLAMIIIFVRKMITSDGGLNSHYYFFFQDPKDIPLYFRYFWEGLPVY